jgi:ABC-type glycerol-3-phosphate transport system substrate-binding protein
MKHRTLSKNSLSRRRFLQTAAIGLVGGILQACAQDAPIADIPTAAPRPESAEPITLTMWYTTLSHEAEYKARQAEIEEKFNIRLNFELLGGGDLPQKLSASLVAGSGFPDIFESYHVTYNQFVKGTDAEIPFFALTDAFASSPYKDTVLESRLAMSTKNEQLYGVPRDVHPEVLLYHDEGWKEYGVDMATVQTWDDFLAACETVGADATMPDGRPRYGIMDLASGGTIRVLLAQNGLWWIDETGQSMLTTPDFRAVVENWLRFKDYWVDMDWENQVEMFKEGQFLAQITPDWLFGVHKQGTAQDTEWLINSPIRMKTVPGGPTTGSWGGTTAGVLKRSPHARLAVEVLLYLYFENGEGQLNTRFAETGILPPVTEAWDSPIFQAPEPYVGGQIAGQLFAEAARHIPVYTQDWRSDIVSESWSEQAELLWVGEIGLDEATATAESNALAGIEKNG